MCESKRHFSINITIISIFTLRPHPLPMGPSQDMALLEFTTSMVHHRHASDTCSLLSNKVDPSHHFHWSLFPILAQLHPLVHMALRVSLTNFALNLFQFFKCTILFCLRPLHVLFAFPETPSTFPLVNFYLLISF